MTKGKNPSLFMIKRKMNNGDLLVITLRYGKRGKIAIHKKEIVKDESLYLERSE